MTLLIDERDLEYDRLARVPGAEVFLSETDRVAESVRHTLIAEDSKVNRFTGHLTELRVEGAPAVLADRAGGETTDGDYIARAKEYLASVSGAIGFAAGEPADFEADPKVTATSGGMRVVSLQQTLNGIEVWGMAPKVWLREDGTVDRVVGDTASVPGNVATMPTVPVETALAAGAEKAAEPVTIEGPFGTDELPGLDVSAGFARLSAQARNDQPMTFEAGAFDKAIPARLVYLYMGDDVRQLVAGLDYTKIHNVGEIWCAALMDMTRRISSEPGSKERGYRTAWQAVVDGLKLTPKNPSFLTARGAILRALKDLRGTSFTEAEYPGVRPAAWKAFARYGMGFDAFCPNASFVGCRAGSLLPPDGHED